MYKYLIVCFIITLQSCSSVKKVKVPTKYPIGINFSSACCGTASQEPICNFISNFLQQNNLRKINVIFSPCLHCDESDYSLYFPLNDVSKKQKDDFIIKMSSIVKSIRPKTESEGTIELTEWNLRPRGKIWKKKTKLLEWAFYSYDSTMINCYSWWKTKPLAASPNVIKMFSR